MGRLTASALISIVFMIMFTGCGSANQISELALVTAVGLDKGSKAGTVRLTVQIIRPADARGQTGAPAGGTGEPVYSVSAEGSTIFEAVRNLARFTTRRVYWAHNFVIVMSEEYAKQGITDMIDFFTRNNQLRMRTWILVTPDNAGKLVSTVTGMEVVPGQAIDKLFRYNEIVGEVPRTNMMRLQEAFLSNSTHPVLAKAQLKKRGISNKKPGEFGSINQVELSGSAVFHNDKFAGYLSPRETRALMFFIEQVDHAVFSLPCSGNSSDSANATASLELINNKFNVKPVMKDGGIGFQVKLSAEFDLVETGCTNPLQEQIELLQEEVEKQIKEDFESLYQKAQQKYKTDILKLGETLNNRYPAQWHKVEERWDDRFPQVEINTEVTAQIKSTVLKIYAPYPGKSE